MTDPGHGTTGLATADAPHGGAAGGHGAHEAGTGHHGGLTYYQVFAILFIVTVAEVGLAYLSMPKFAKIVIFVVMALYKAVMVALYFMHLKFEKKTMWIIAAAPLIFGVILAIGTYPDSEKGTGRFQRGELDPWTAAEPTERHE
jgi:cytochrome c oxidase subunit 4